MVRHSRHSKISYAEVSKQPLYMLVFLLPLIFLYEFALYKTEGKIQIKAHDHLVKFFDLADMPPTRGLWLGGILIIAILGIWQIYSGNRWKIDFRYIAFMAVESVLAAVPLLGLGVVFGSMVATATDASIGSLGLFEKLSVSIGAGLYEELVFRMMIIALVHTVACSIFKQSEIVGLFVGVIVSAILFSLYHDLPDAGTLPPISLFFYGVAGVYLGILFVLRGFGITAAAHATYDIVATTLLAVLVA